MTHKLRALSALRVETEYGPVLLDVGARLNAATKVASELVLADLALPLDEAETHKLCAAVDALDRTNA